MNLVSINITHHDTVLMNTDQIPLLYYWDGETNDLINDIVSSEYISQFINTNICTCDIYDTAKLSYFTYEIDEQNNEQYANHTVMIQTVLPLYRISTPLYLKYALTVFNKIYHNAFNVDFTASDTYDNVLMNNDESRITEIYKQVKQKYGTRISLKTLLEYMRSQLSENTHLSVENINFIYEKIETLLQENE